MGTGGIHPPTPFRQMSKNSRIQTAPVAPPFSFPPPLFSVASRLASLHYLLYSILIPFFFELRYLPALLAPGVASVTFTPVAGRITILLPNRALGDSYALAFSHITTAFLAFSLPGTGQGLCTR